MIESQCAFYIKADGIWEMIAGEKRRLAFFVTVGERGVVTLFYISENKGVQVFFYPYLKTDAAIKMFQCCR